jgi:hypothetical protein
MKYYFGIYVDYTDANRPRIAQVMESVDDLSCEMLANPGLITFNLGDRSNARSCGKKLAALHNCKFIEFGWGKYQLIKVKKL